MQILTQKAFDALIDKADVLKTQPEVGAVVYKTPDDIIVKLFYRQARRWSSFLSTTKSQRFVANCRRLQKMHIPSLQVLNHYQFVDKRFDVVTYAFLAGNIVSDQLLTHGSSAIAAKLVVGMLEFVANLHRHNVYFCDGHFSNYVCLADGQFAIIDCGNLKFRLDIRRRAKNIVFMLFYPKYVSLICDMDLNSLLNHYLQHSHLCVTQQKRFLQYFCRYLDNVVVTKYQHSNATVASKIMAFRQTLLQPNAM